MDHKTVFLYSVQSVLCTPVCPLYSDRKAVSLYSFTVQSVFCTQIVSPCHYIHSRFSLSSIGPTPVCPSYSDHLSSVQ